MGRGEHFAAMEQPAALAKEIKVSYEQISLTAQRFCRAKAIIQIR